MLVELRNRYSDQKWKELPTEGDVRLKLEQAMVVWTNDPGNDIATWGRYWTTWTQPGRGASMVAALTVLNSYLVGHKHKDGTNLRYKMLDPGQWTVEPDEGKSAIGAYVARGPALAFFGPVDGVYTWHAGMIRNVEKDTEKTAWGKTRTTDWYWVVYGDAGYAMLDSEATLQEGLTRSMPSNGILVPAW
jgi:hypothetical protein